MYRWRNSERSAGDGFLRRAVRHHDGRRRQWRRRRFQPYPIGLDLHYQRLYSFCSSSGCTDGNAPLAGLIIDSSGNLWGTTSVGGAINGGLVFELVKPTPPSTTWTLNPIYSFCSVMMSSVCTDGQTPKAQLTYSGAESGTPYDGHSLLFGTTYSGGATSGTPHNVGVVYALHLASGIWSEKAIHTFAGTPFPSDGEQPETGLVMDATTNVLWGTAQGGGTASAGIAFSLTPGNHLWTSPWTEAVLYNFCWQGFHPCTDGSGPSGIVRDSSGNLYDATVDGGIQTSTNAGDGLVFKLTNGNCSKGGTGGFWCNTVLYDFCPSIGCADGLNPALSSNLAMDSSGNLYGTTPAGGANGDGIVYELSGATETVLHSFCSQTNCKDGEMPVAGVILDSSGDLYGTTSAGGRGSSGTAFEISP
jgi:uncharacterized repeat protein (TIGR03803 family)